MGKKKLRTAIGRPYNKLDNSQSVGNGGPILLQAILCMKKWHISIMNVFLKASFTQKDWELLLTKRNLITSS